MKLTKKQRKALQVGYSFTFILHASVHNVLQQRNKHTRAHAHATAQLARIAELKQGTSRPDVVEVWDVTAPDPHLLVFLKVGGTYDCLLLCILFQGLQAGDDRLMAAAAARCQHQPASASCICTY